MSDPENAVNDAVLFGKFDAHAGNMIPNARDWRKTAMVMPCEDGVAAILNAMKA